MSGRSEHGAVVSWQRNEAAFVDSKYSREHRWRFDGGVEVRASAAPANVPVPYAVAEAVDPEEAFVASIASCHMLWFLALAAKRGFVVDRYEDSAVGTMGKNTDGKLMVATVLLRPRADFSGALRPTRDEIEALHHRAHEECFIANSVRSEVLCVPQ